MDWCLSYVHRSVGTLLSAPAISLQMGLTSDHQHQGLCAALNRSSSMVGSRELISIKN